MSNGLEMMLSTEVELLQAENARLREELAAAQAKQEPVAWMHWYKYYDGTDVVKVAIGHATTFNDQSPFRSEPLYAAPVVQQKAEPIRHALENCRLFAARHRKEEWAGHILRFCADSGAIGSTMRESVVQPDMVMVPREPTEAMLDAAMNRYHHISPEAKARYTQMHRENFRWDYKAMIAAAEGKSNANVCGLPHGKEDK